MTRLFRKDPEQGSALVTALVLVALMSVVAIAIMDTVRFATRVSVNVAAREQARLYAIGAEQLAAGTLAELRADGAIGEAYPALDLWVRTPVEYPIPGGSISGRVIDGGNCFNLNSLVVDQEGLLIAQPRAAAELARTLALSGIGVSEAERLSAVITDWIDSDSRPGFGGAEDPFYVTRDPPYRTPGQYMTDVSELKLMRGVSPEIYAAVRPYVCVRPNALPSVLNLNTLELWQAPLLASVLGEEFDAASAERFLSDRPVAGFGGIDEALSSPLLSLNDERRTALSRRLALASNYYDLKVTVRYREAVIRLSATLQIASTGNITTVSRHYGSME